MSPPIVLMRNQVSALQVGGVAADLLDSPQPPEEPTRIRQGALGSSHKILYSTPIALRMRAFSRSWHGCIYSAIPLRAFY